MLSEGDHRGIGAPEERQDGDNLGEHWAVTNKNHSVDVKEEREKKADRNGHAEAWLYVLSYLIALDRNERVKYRP